MWHRMSTVVFSSLPEDYAAAEAHQSASMTA